MPNNINTGKSLEGYNGISGSYESSRATNRGTRIVKKGNELDKNAFLRILTAELSNQDPTNAKDSTQFVSQLAQFSSLEQMANLNSTMSFSSAQSLVGKVVALNDYDSRGMQYGGQVVSVNKNGDDIKLTVQVVENGKTTLKDFSFSSVEDVIHLNDNRLDYINSNMGFLLASNMMEKKIEAKVYELNEKGEKVEKTYSGMVKGISRDSNGINLKVLVEQDGKVEEKYIPYDAVVKVDMINLNNMD
ncbi:flagellar hook capping FlgD N-terminal domain-containing protein [Haloimpatiens lingqiaonensis]|uniref:flagellar hook capping FlgD N-terminal domain-containing protein n=1 Tax=Haloimpatiens lingqiaonensis TaxID=1380675 RepID=UPI0010FE4C60|nr:flagellar hook capping FlgD N-terminal domain-containing protein [Haloimpatiens lingqiaonensis]